MTILKTGALRLMQALGLFTTKAHPVQMAAPKARRMSKGVGYGQALTDHRTAQQLQKLNSKKAQ